MLILLMLVLQRVEEPRVQWITEQLQALDTADSADQAPKLKSGNLCLARFSVDKQLYRARVEAADHSDPVCPSYLVTFIDFGNKEKVKATSVKAIDAALSAVPPQAQAASLAYLKVHLTSLLMSSSRFAHNSPIHTVPKPALTNEPSSLEYRVATATCDQITIAVSGQGVDRSFALY